MILEVLHGVVKYLRGLQLLQPELIPEQVHRLAATWLRRLPTEDAGEDTRQLVDFAFQKAS